VSLILEALKKLEREKQSPDRGFLVLGPGTWSQAPGGGRRMALALLGAVLLGAAAGTAFWRVREAGSPPLPATLPGPVAPAVPAGAPPSSPLLADTADTMPRLPPPAPTPSAVPIEARVALPESPPPVEARPLAREQPPLPLDEPPPRRAAADVPVQASEAPPSAAPTPAGPEPRFRLQAISRRDDRLVAVLSGRLVYEGDSFEDVRVLRIGETEVELEVDGRRVVVGF
jgi:hypothetical protein